jgi:hypothetical protein
LANILRPFRRFVRSRAAVGSLQGAWPFGPIEAIWSAVALRRWICAIDFAFTFPQRWAGGQKNAASARNKGVKPTNQGVSATGETSGKPGDLESEEKDAADILGGNATGDKKRVDAAIAHHAKTDKRAG